MDTVDKGEERNQRAITSVMFEAALCHVSSSSSFPAPRVVCYKRQPLSKNGHVAVWNCVFYQVRIYQESIISEIPDLVAVAHARAKPNGPTIAPQSIIDHLKSAVKVCARKDTGLFHAGGILGVDMADSRTRV